ncbi:MAG: hypothetical protein ACXWZS_05080 [Gemmatirosa sp.]
MPGRVRVTPAQDFAPAEPGPRGEGSTLAPGGMILLSPFVRQVPGAATGELLVAGTIALWGALRVRRRALGS